MTLRPYQDEEQITFFVSYAHQNKTWFSRLRPLLNFYEPSTHIAGNWHDQKLKAGDRWHQEIRDNLELMDIFVCLVSYDFLDSDFIRNEELPRALQRERDGEVEILPIILYEMDLEYDYPPLYAFSPLPKWDKCWRNYERDDGEQRDAHYHIRQGFRDAIDKVRIKRKKAIA